MEFEVDVEKNQQDSLAYDFTTSGSIEMENDHILFGNPSRNANEAEVTRDTEDFTVTPKTTRMYKIAVIGESIVGKTAICEAFCKKNFTAASKYWMTCGVEIYGKCVTGNSVLQILGSNGDGPQKINSKDKLNLILIDSSGKEIYREYLPKYWDKVDGIAIVIDLTCETSLQHATSWLDFVQASIVPASSKPIGVLIGNKADLKSEIVIRSEEASKFAAEHNLEYFECSVRNNFGFEEPFLFMARNWFESSGKKENKNFLSK